MPTKKALWTTTLFLAFCFAPSVRAIYIQPQLEQVPIERLIRNLERMANDEPKNVQLRINLARAHAMAFANAGADVQIQRDQQQAGVWFGPASRHVPFPIAPGAGPTVGNTQKAHLTAAIVAYEQALGLEPSNSIARLGYGWCLDVAGERDRAVDAYRRVIAETWAREQAQPGFPPGPGPVTAEAAGYLLFLLDPAKDGAEIDRLKGYVSELSKRPRSVTPIVVPLVVPLVDATGGPLMIDSSARVRFDADGSALDREWTWISKDAGWLVYDQRGAGQVSSALQLFGNVTFWMFWENGYDAMRALDDDGDGKLAGAELAGLAIWRDVNGDGVSDAGEVKSLAAWGIVELSCAYESEDESDVFIASSKAGVTFADGSTRATYDVLLHRR